MRILLIFLVSFCLPIEMVSQEKVLKKRSKVQLNPENNIIKAEAIKAEQPLVALELIEQIIVEINQNKAYSHLMSETYFLLGEIYGDIGQEELALNRYNLALDYIKRSRKQYTLEPNIYKNMGAIMLKLEYPDRSEEYYKLCIETAGKDFILSRSCQEGLIDVNLQKKRLKNAQNILNSFSKRNEKNPYSSSTYGDTSSEIGTIIQNDSLLTSRLSARQSQIFFLQNQPEKASEYLFNSVNTLPTNITLTAEDLEPIKKAQDQLLLDMNFSIEEKKEVIGNVNYSIRDQDDISLKQNLKNTTFFEEKNEIGTAEEIVEKSKLLITEETDAEIVAEIYKRSADYNMNKQQYTAALKDLDQYSKAKEIAVNNQSKELKNQIDIVKKQQNIDILSKDYDLQVKDRTLTDNQMKIQQLIIGFLAILLISALVFFYSMAKSIRAQKRANKMLNLKSLRTQMNPHFIFNALNSVNNFIAKNDDISANKYLGDFSHLMRQVLDHSQKDFITFEEEAQLNERYLKLEHSRFRDRFDFTFENHISDEGLEIDIPPMLIQPFIENAVWHGLRYKDDKGLLTVKMKDTSDEIVVEIIDDGIGRKRSQELKTNNQKKYKSKGLSNIKKRIDLLNQLYNKAYEIEVNDAFPTKKDKGTQVTITIPKTR